LAFHVSLDQCTGCKACQLACQDKNDLDATTTWRRVLEYSGGTWIIDKDLYIPSGNFTYFTPVSCMHCENPPCMEVCPAGAITKRDSDGVVLINADQCIGCRYCQWACPYGALWFKEETGKMAKCDFCVDLLAKGQKPACVDACPYRSLDFGTLEELQAKYGDLADPAPLPDASMTGPSIVFTPHKDTQPTQAGTGKIINLEEV
ncbi:MAG: DMSO/selenate family reductase complex B subunit, partial [Chloroflexota bacterium]